MTRHRLGSVALLAVVLLRSVLAGERPTQIPILLSRPDTVMAPRWPVTLGVPFKRGDCRDIGVLAVVDEAGETVPAQIVKAGDWEDGSLRWVHVDFVPALKSRYFLSISDRPVPAVEREDDIRAEESSQGLVITTGGARYVFDRKGGCFENLSLDLDGDGKFGEGEALVHDSASAFYVVDSLGRRGVLDARELRIETRGARHTVVRIEGDYLTEDGKRNAAGIVYFHFYAGLPSVRISHKFIVTANTNDLWFRDIGVTFPVDLGKGLMAAFNAAHGRPLAVFSKRIAPGRALTMAQTDFPHFGSTTSVARITEASADGVESTLKSMAACGEWVDLSSARCGLAVQVPAFAEQYPKAFRLSEKGVSIGLWAREGGKALDYRTEQIAKNYLGHDWLPSDHELLKLPNTAHGSAKTHELWLYPHPGDLAPERAAGFGATRREIFAYIDPQWVARTRIFGPLAAKNAKRFPQVEAALSDYWDRSVVAQKKVFPTNGYLYYGCYPFGAQPWRPKKEQGGRWYPTIHRLSRHMDYDMRRSMWQLFSRSGDRRYYDYARRYTRFMHDLIFANTDTPLKPLGWFAQGSWHSPIVWGHCGDGKVPADYEPEAYNTDFTLTLASSADMVQFVYDYFLTGDRHSRDMAYHWKNAMVKEMKFDVPKALGLFRPDCFIRMLSAAYELDHDPRLLDYGRRIVRAIIPEKGPEVLRPKAESGARINYGKAGEIFAAFYYYYVATGDPLVKEAFARLGDLTLRRNWFDRFFSRGSPLFQALSLAYEETGKNIHAIYTIQTALRFGENWKTLAEDGIDLDTLSQQTTTSFGHRSLVGQAPINVGVPVALGLATSYDGPLPELPHALKPHPTARAAVFLKKEKPGAAELNLYVNNWGHVDYAPRLLDGAGKECALEAIERDFKYVTEPECYDQNSIWMHKHGDHFYFRLRVPATVPPGVYELDLGAEVNFTVLYSEIDKILQVAPDGLPILRGRPYYFALPPGVKEVEYFAHRQPVRICDPDGQAIESEDLKQGRYRFDAEGKAGAWQMRSEVDTFIRILSVTTADAEPMHYPLVIALGSAERLFDVPTRRFPPALERLPWPGKFDPKSPFTDGSVSAKFGKALHVNRHFAEIAAPGTLPVPGAEEEAADRRPLPRERGTVEFWMRPRWSATDSYYPRATHRTQLYKADPISISYWVDPDNGGRTGRYDIVKLVAQIHGIGYTQCRVYLDKGQWYHLAVTWEVDGKNNRAFIFINGRKKAYSLYKPGLPKDAPPDKIAASGPEIRLGAGDWYGRMFVECLFDELRISSTVRYTDSFAVPNAPFQADQDTYLLMHFDGDLAALMAGKTASGKLKAGRLW